MLATFAVGQVLWSMFWFFIFVLWIMLLFHIFGDIFRSDDLGGWGKSLWTIGVIIVPFLGVFLYLIIRGGKMQQRQIAAAAKAQSDFNSYVQETAGSAADPGDQLAKLADLKAKGVIDDAEFAAAKAKILN